MRCAQCQNEVPDRQRYCGRCGAVIEAATTQTSIPYGAGLPRPSVELPPPPEVPHSVGASSRSSISSIPGTRGSAERFAPGTIVAERYRIVGLLGRGGMGEVYRADDLKLDQPVALKFLPGEFADDGERLARFLSEVRIARQVAHANVCRVYDVGEIDGHHFLSMEYIDGEDLASLLRRIGRLPRDKALQIARQLCAGLAAAHHRGILHRDLKPANVMIDGRGHVRITDFGLAGLAGDFRGAEIRAGTPDYMAPEQLAGREVSVRSDLYALGHVLYEVFTGQRTFRADSVAELTRMQTETPPTQPSEFVADIDPIVERVILRCLEKDPEDRPSSALEVAASLPGGDPLAAALAAGETPSPEMVAAAGPRGGMRPGLALTCVVIAIGGALLAALAATRHSLVGLAGVERPAAALTDEARRIVRSLGYDETPVDAASRFVFNESRLRAIAQQESGPDRWERLSEPEQRAVYFFYRQSPAALVPGNLGTVVQLADPPPIPGDVALTLDLTGRLTSLRVVAPAMERSPEPAPEIDWAPLLAAAGFDPAQLVPLAPTMQPMLFTDTRAAWEGTRATGQPVRLEAAAVRGRPVHLEVLSPADPRWSLESVPTEDAVGPWVVVVLLLIFLIIAVTAGLLAVRHWKMGRGDRRGALRLALTVLVLRLCYWAFSAHHVSKVTAEFGLLISGLGLALFFAALTWVLYVALEPYVRRLWPHALVSWTRLLSGRWGDPLIGRDVLIGLAAGALLHLLDQGVYFGVQAMGLPPSPPAGLVSVHALEGGRLGLAMLFHIALMSLAAPLTYFAFFLLLKLVFRLQAIAIAAFCLITAMLGMAQVIGIEPAPTLPMVSLAFLFGLVNGAALTTLLVRWGLVATSACLVFVYVAMFYPLTLDASRPYFATSLIGLAAIALLAVWAFRRALAGQQIFRDGLLPEPRS